MLLWQHVWICKHLTQIHWGKERTFCQSLPLAPHLTKISRLVHFGLAKVFKRIAFDTSHGTISKVKPTIFFQEHTEYLDIKKAHLARPHWGMHWAPSPLCCYFLLHWLCRRACDLLTVPSHSIACSFSWLALPQRVQLLGFPSAQFMSFLWCSFVRETSGMLQKFSLYHTSQYLHWKQALLIPIIKVFSFILLSK